MYVLLYSKRIVYVTLFSMANAAVLYFVIRALSLGGSLETNIFAIQKTHFVFTWAVVAYAIVAVGLMNTLILFCFSQPEIAYRSILYSLLVNLSLGFMLSRWIDYSWAVMGLFTGGLVFAFTSSREVLKVLKNLDYYVYTAV
jgi:hypothetical protein